MGSQPIGQKGEPRDVFTFFKKLGARYKRIRRRCKRAPLKALYEFKIACLKELEQLSESGQIDLFYGDESSVCSEGYVPYGWQFPGENVFVPSEKGDKLNLFGLISRQNDCRFWASEANIDAAFIVEKLDRMSFEIKKPTFIVLDCARLHTGKRVAERIEYWQNRGLFIFFLPPYSPHLNLAETLWRKLKKEWIKPEDYAERDLLFYAANQILASVGKTRLIHFNSFNLS